jgi:septal ring factor EnvC (AmiA/AmiB activator)
MKPRFILAAFVMCCLTVLLAPRQSDAANIYRWTDEQGRTHLSDTVPERYKKVAIQVDSKEFELSEREKSDAAARLAKERAQAEAAAQRARADAAARPAAASVQASAASSASDKTESECDRLWRTYTESQECFAPYQTRFGTRPEAFERCKSVENPSQRCGPAKNIEGG